MKGPQPRTISKIYYAKGPIHLVLLSQENLQRTLRCTLVNRARKGGMKGEACVVGNGSPGLETHMENPQPPLTFHPTLELTEATTFLQALSAWTKHSLLYIIQFRSEGCWEIILIRLTGANSMCSGGRAACQAQGPRRVRGSDSTLHLGQPPRWQVVPTTDRESAWNMGSGQIAKETRRSLHE